MSLTRDEARLICAWTSGEIDHVDDLDEAIAKLESIANAPATEQESVREVPAWILQVLSDTKSDAEAEIQAFAAAGDYTAASLQQECVRGVQAVIDNIASEATAGNTGHKPDFYAVFSGRYCGDFHRYDTMDEARRNNDGSTIYSCYVAMKGAIDGG